MRYNSSTDRTVAWTDTYSTSYVTGDIAGSPKTEHRGDYSMRKCTHSSDEIRLYFIYSCMVARRSSVYLYCVSY